MKAYETEEDIAELVASFEAATISRDDWKHREHLIVALYYVSHFDIEIAIDKMRGGILNLLANGFGVNLDKEMPYHETITVFWIKSVADFHASTNGKTIVEKVDEMVSRFDKDDPLKFYTRERLFSDEARARFVAPDLIPIGGTKSEIDASYGRI
jgi:hypothetical protein